MDHQDLRSFLELLKSEGLLVEIDKPVSTRFEIASMLAERDGTPMLFTNVKGHPGFRVLGGIGSKREYFALALGISSDRLLFALKDALEHPKQPEMHSEAPWMEERAESLDDIPFLWHWPGDGGAYATASIMFLMTPEGENASFHRLLKIDGRHMVARLVEGRSAHRAWTDTEEDIPVAISIGLPPHILLAASMSPPEGLFEMLLANSLSSTPLAESPIAHIPVPVASEIVIEGRLTHKLEKEGPFVDLTGTMDIVRMQPVIEVDAIFHRRDPIYQALLPGMREHRLLMGMPREPTIFDAVSKVAKCLNVYITPGGCSWLHAVVQIEKHTQDDGKRAGMAAFEGHPSLKHVVVVEEDVNIFSPEDVEWAIATRFQADKDLVVLSDMPSSSLDPSARHIPGKKSRGVKMVLDATIPWDSPAGASNKDDFKRLIRF